MIHCANLGDRKRAFCGPTAVSILTGVDVGHIEEIIHEERNRFEYIKRILHDLPFMQARANCAAACSSSTASCWSALTSVSAGSCTRRRFTEGDRIMLPAPVFTYHYLWRTYADLMHRFPSTAPVFHAALIGCLQPWMDNNERLIASWRAERRKAHLQQLAKATVH